MVQGQISPWLPEQDRILLAVLGKLIEECNELSARAARCILHGIDEIDPDSGRKNREELAREVADVTACINILREVTHCEADVTRAMQKRLGFRRWHKLIRELEAVDG